MAIKAGQILHLANQFVIDRIQTAGPGQLNIPQDRIHELGNQRSVGIVRDIPDLTFALDCLETDTEVEALLTGSIDPLADAAGTKYELINNSPIDIVSAWTTKFGQYAAVHGVAVPYLFLESANYRYGVTADAGENFSLRGDSIYYIPGSGWQDKLLGSDLVSGVHTFAHGPALLYRESGRSNYALAVTVNGDRLLHGHDFTETATGITFTAGSMPAAEDKISVIYGSAASTTYSQDGVTPYGAGDANLVHQGIGVKPAAIRGKDIDVFFATAIPGVDLGAGAGQPVEIRWTDVQAATIQWQQTLDIDREFGNVYAVDRQAVDVPVVNGTVDVKPRSVEAWFTKLRQLSGISDLTQIMGPQSSLTGALRIEIRNPESGGSTAIPAGQVIKTHYVPDARFVMPGYSATVQQKVSASLTWDSDTGIHEIFKGSRS